MKKKMIALVLVALMIMTVLVGCGQSAGDQSTDDAGTTKEDTTSTDANTPDEAEEDAANSDTGSESDTDTDKTDVETTTLKVNLTVGTTDPQYAWWQDFAARVEEASEGTLKLELYTDQSLGTNDEITAAVAEGGLFINVPDYAGLVDYCDDASIYHVPYLIQEPEQIYELWQSELGQEIDQKIADNGIRVICAMYFGTRNVISSKPIESAEDFGNIKLRVGTSKMWNFTAECLGANATNTAWSEVYSALTSGVADACESPSTLLYSSKVYEVCKYLVKTEHLVCNSAVIMSEEVYQSLPDVARTALETVGKEFAQESVQLTSSVADEYDQKLVDEGVTIVEIDKTPFIEYSQNNVEANFPEWSEGLYQRAYEVLYGE